jgi:hypothetical protein
MFCWVISSFLFAQTLAARAGVAKIDATLPIGAPLAGYNDAPRRAKAFPLPEPTNYTTYMTPSTGVIDPNYAKALVIEDDNGTRVCLVTMDAIGTDNTLMKMAYDMALSMGFTVPFERVTSSGSHSHSGPGAISPSYLFAIAPAADLLVPALQRQMARTIAQVMVTAEKNLAPCAVGLGQGEMIGFTHNRRNSPTEWFEKIDPRLGVMRVDDAQGKPVATVWNFAIHGICFDETNLKYSSDIMGNVSQNIENTVGGVALFINSDAGDINPRFDVTCTDTKGNVDLHGGPPMAKIVTDLRASLPTTKKLTVKMQSVDVDFGNTNLNLTLQRIINCTQGGPLDICTLCKILKCEDNIHLGPAWIETVAKFTALHWKLDMGGSFNEALMLTVPGEALVELGWWIRNDTLQLGFQANQSWILGYTNNYMGYFAPPDEYLWGDYESIFTLWGIGTAQMVRENAIGIARAVLGL